VHRKLSITFHKIVSFESNIIDILKAQLLISEKNERIQSRILPLSEAVRRIEGLLEKIPRVFGIENFKLTEIEFLNLKDLFTNNSLDLKKDQQILILSTKTLRARLDSFQLLLKPRRTVFKAA